MLRAECFKGTLLEGRHFSVGNAHKKNADAIFPTLDGGVCMLRVGDACLGASVGVDDVVVANTEPSLTHDDFLVLFERKVCLGVEGFNTGGLITLLECEVLRVPGYLSFFFGFSFKPFVSFCDSRNHDAGMSFAA